MFRRLPLTGFGWGLALAACYSAVTAAEPAGGNAPPSLEPVVWAGPGTTFESLLGKTTVVVTYVTWCPKCNEWSGEPLADLAAELRDKPVVVLALSTDTPPDKARLYMAQRQFAGPRVLHGYDPTIARRFGFENEFFNYAIIGPDGAIAARGDLGTYENAPGDKKYTVARDLARLADRGRFRFVTDEMSDALKELVFPMELGTWPTSADSARLKRALRGDDRQAFDDMLKNFLDEQLADAERQVAGSAPEKLTALRTATYLNASFKATEQGKKAAALLKTLNQDADFKKELAAKRMYDQCLKQPNRIAARQAELLRGVARKFPGTHYAAVAGTAADAALQAADDPQ
ncbi:MAG: peroxiredoxin family protein [Planctomycetaceae bacterium]